MSEQQAAAADAGAARLSEIRGKHDGCIASGDDLCDVPYLLSRLDARRADLARAVERVDRLQAEVESLRATGDELATYAHRVVRGEGTTQRYEYLCTATAAWQALRQRPGPGGAGWGGRLSE